MLEGGGLPVVGLRTVRACALRCLASQPPRACRILFWNLASALQGCPVPRLGGQFRAAEGAGLQGCQAGRAEWPSVD